MTTTDESEPMTTRVTVYLPTPLVKRLKAYAVSRGVGLSVLIRMMLSAGMERES